MDFMDILKQASSLIEQDDDKATSGLDVGDITNALSSILGDSSDNSSIDLNSIVSNLRSDSPITNIVKSWLGDGDNESISENSLIELIGENKIDEFATILGIGKSSAIGALARNLPDIIDTISNKDSSITDDILGMAKIFFK